MSVNNPIYRVYKFFAYKIGNRVRVFFGKPQRIPKLID